MTTEERLKKYKHIIDDIEQIESMRRQGLSNGQIAEEYGIAESTLKTLSHACPALFEALKRGREEADRKVENALFKAATGYTVDVVKPQKLRQTRYDDKGRRYDYEIIEDHTERQYVKPDNAAMIFWLKNRKGDEWHDRKEVRSDIDMVGGVVMIPSIDSASDGVGGSDKGDVGK